MSIFRTRDQKYYGGSAQEIHFRSSRELLGEFFFYLSPLLNILHFGLSLSHCDVGFQSRDVSFPSSGMSRRVRSQRRDVGLDLLWNIAMLDPNIVTSFLHYSGTSRRWIPTSRHWIPTSQRQFFYSSGMSRRWISTLRRWFCTPLESRDVGSQRRDAGFNHSLERRDVGLNVATLAASFSGTSRCCIRTSRR